MSVFKRKGSPFFYCEFVIAGRRVSRSTGCTSAREARSFERALKKQERAKIRRGTIEPALTVEQACARYWTQHGCHLSERWALEVERHLKTITAVIDRDLPIADLGNKDVDRLITTRRADGVANGTINRTLAVLKGLHRRAARKWDISVRIIDWPDMMLKEPKERVRWLTPETATAFLAAFPPETELLVRFLLLTGLRRGEVFGLTWDRVHLDRMAVEVIAKGGIRREVAIEAEAALILQQCPRGSRYVFDTTNWRRRFQAALKASGITDFRWHDLRHTHATWMRQRGASIEVVSKSLGHSSIAVTMRYAHVDQSEVREALRALPSIGTSNEGVTVFKPRKKKYNLP